ncbi:TetR/AcrR family transcriptional regulator [Streptomyces sp. SR27]|uniref:TetR/AcrR family transcriptional regulator n=1 Tax=Streptomyces sp. SR27 TaxID=3076630 RepID=UPI00295BB230|nr:TetR/AcrR family transcriptional regulator [Streptomyces sp. SR27]MDV9186978.1 TetR/AcrR family transcriptional regulator [Streptomyces sp. SR27]
MTPEPTRPLRADAERNRRLIMRTAARLFAQCGATLPLNEIAREAGIGVGTAYRRFPNLQSLIDTLFTERFTTFLDLASASARQLDAGQALRHYLMEAAARRAGDRAIEVVLAHASVEAEPIARMRDELARLVEGLAERAVASGAARTDFAAADVYAFLHMVGAVADRTYDIAPDAWRRYAEVLLIGFGLAPGPAAHLSAMTDGQVRRTWPKPMS